MTYENSLNGSFLIQTFHFTLKTAHAAAADGFSIVSAPRVLGWKLIVRRHKHTILGASE